MALLRQQGKYSPSHPACGTRDNDLHRFAPETIHPNPAYTPFSRNQISLNSLRVWPSFSALSLPIPQRGRRSSAVHLPISERAVFTGMGFVSRNIAVWREKSRECNCLALT